MDTKVDKGVIVRMLIDYAKLIDKDCRRRFAELDNESDDIAGHRRCIAALDGIIADNGGIPAIRAAAAALEAERQDELVERFAGGMSLPTSPLDLVAFATSMLEDWDSPELHGYIGEAEDWDEDEEPIRAAFYRAHAAELELRTTTPEAATAIVLAAERDNAVYCGDRWNWHRVAWARRRMLPSIPRPR